MLLCLMFFTLGAFCYAFLSKVLKYYQLINYTHQMNISILLMLRSISSNSTQAWKDLMVKRIIESYPKNMRPSIKFQNWNEAMAWLAKNGV